MTLSFTVEGVPRGKGRPRFTTKGRFPQTYTDAETRAYEEQIAWAAKAAGAKPVPNACRISVTLGMPLPKSWSIKKKDLAWHAEGKCLCLPDVDNALKIVMDALNGVAWKDDRQVFEATIHKVYVSLPELSCQITYLP